MRAWWQRVRTRLEDALQQNDDGAQVLAEIDTILSSSRSSSSSRVAELEAELSAAKEELATLRLSSAANAQRDISTLELEVTCLRTRATQFEAGRLAALRDLEASILMRFVVA